MFAWGTLFTDRPNALSNHQRVVVAFTSRFGQVRLILQFTTHQTSSLAADILNINGAGSSPPNPDVFSLTASGKLRRSTSHCSQCQILCLRAARLRPYERSRLR